jgi:hypothetical protein
VVETEDPPVGSEHGPGQGQFTEDNRRFDQSRRPRLSRQGDPDRESADNDGEQDGEDRSIKSVPPQPEGQRDWCESDPSKPYQCAQ